MSTTTLLPGVRVHPNGRSLQVRIAPFKPKAGFPLDGHEANAYALELHRRKSRGVLVAPAEIEMRTTTLADVTREHLDRLATAGGRGGRPYSPESMAQARKACRPWLGEPTPDRTVKGTLVVAPQAVDDDGIPFGDLPLAALRVRPVEVYLERRSKDTPRAAVGEYQELRSILRLAARRGETFDQGLLALEPLRRRPRERKHRGLPLDQLRYMAAHVPEHERRILLLGATLGCRITELLLIEDGWIDLDARTLTIPAWACKERRTKVLDLLPEEVALIREQRLVRSPNTVDGRDGTPMLFARKHGTAWTANGFWADVVEDARADAAKAWRADHDLAADAETPFDGWAPHDLRRGAATLLRQIGVPAELVAARLGHADNGELVDRVYAEDTRRERLRDHLAAIDAAGGIEACLAAAAKGRA